VVVEAPAELDSASAEAFRDELALALAFHDPWIVVDMSATTFVDSSGVGALVAAYKLAAAGGGSLSLRHTSDGVLRTLRLMGLDGVLGASATTPSS